MPGQWLAAAARAACGGPYAADVKFAVEVPVRWSDMDAYGHVNHARTVTLIEDARTRLVFEELPRRGLRSFLDGLVVARVAVDYVAPIGFDDSPVHVVMWVETIRAASFVLRYELRAADRLVARAETTMAPYDVPRARLRRLTPQERATLQEWGADGGTVTSGGAA